MNSGNVPVVIGPGPALYIVDDHHSLCALDFSGFDETSVTFDVLCDMRHLTPNDFWNELQGQNLAFLVAHPYNDSMELPKAISFQDIPSYFAFTATDKSLSDDPWRSVAGFSRKVKVAAPPAPKCDSTSSEYCERCMYRGCVDGYQKEGAGVAFFEFRWGYLFNDATYYSTNLWPSESERQSFLKIFEALGHEEVGKMDMSAWMDAASHVVNLCRSESLSKYQLDTKLFPGTSSLPGYMATYQPLPDDPVCNSPTCKWGRDR